MISWEKLPPQMQTEAVKPYYEKTKFVMVASCSGALLNILLNYIFIGLYGYYAADLITCFFGIGYCDQTRFQRSCVL